MQQSIQVNIHVKTQYLADRLSDKDQYPFSYHITITNQSEQPVQLINRYWLITDGNGKQTEVQGEGVVGQQPRLKVGESFQYSSGAILDTPIGTMQGFYEMQTEDGATFQAPIERFSLAVPNILN